MINSNFPLGRFHVGKNFIYLLLEVKAKHTVQVVIIQARRFTMNGRSILKFNFVKKNNNNYNQQPNLEESILSFLHCHRIFLESIKYMLALSWIFLVNCVYML